LEGEPHAAGLPAVGSHRYLGGRGPDAGRRRVATTAPRARRRRRHGNRRRLPINTGILAPDQDVVDARNSRLPYHMTSDSLGYRGHGFPRRKEAGEFRILFTGDSFRLRRVSIASCGAEGNNARADGVGHPHRGRDHNPRGQPAYAIDGERSRGGGAVPLALRRSPLAARLRDRGGVPGGAARSVAPARQQVPVSFQAAPWCVSCRRRRAVVAGRNANLAGMKHRCGMHRPRAAPQRDIV